MDVSRYEEGRTKLAVPRLALEVVPPPTSPVFFNPAAALNRDVTVAMTAAAGGATFCDSMAGVGARGVRVANEVEDVSEVTMVDFNPDALRLARRSARINGVTGKCRFAKTETTSYLCSRFGRDQRFAFVDVDPFGSPIRQLQAALSATSDGGILSVTATDTAVLCGVHVETCQRRYGSTPLNNHFHHETGIRILLAAVARIGGAIDIGVEPVGAHSTRHYIRVYARIRPGASRAGSALKNLGKLSWCPRCGDVKVQGSGVCGVCGKKTRVAGPLWLGGIADEKLVKAARKEALGRDLIRAAEVFESLAGVNEFPPWSFDIDAVCSGLRVPTVSELAVRRILMGTGRRVMRTPFERAGLKSDATYAELVDAVREAGRTTGAPVSAPRSSSRARS